MKKILIIRFRRVGDAVLSSTLCTSLKKTFPEAEIHYVLNEGIAPLFEHHPDIDKLITFDNKELNSLPTYTSKVWKIMRATKYDIIIDTRSTIKTLFFSLFSLRTKYRIGRWKKYNRLIHNYRINNYFDGVNDAIDMNLALLKPLEDKHTIRRERQMKLYITDAEKDAFRKYMTQKGIDFSRPIIVCAVATRVVKKAFEHSKMGQVVGAMLENYPNVQLVFNYSGHNEKQMAQDVFEYLNKDERVFMNIEAPSLRDLSAMLANSTLFFGNDGGPRHIAQALGIPAFAIFPEQATIKEWLPNPSEVNKGIELKVARKQMALNPDWHTLSEEEQWQLELNEIWLALDSVLAKLITVNEMPYEHSENRNP